VYSEGECFDSPLNVFSPKNVVRISRLLNPLDWRQKIYANDRVMKMRNKEHYNQFHVLGEMKNKRL